jgi:poly-beta-1,6-N-acetyl-D-glucosamine synthase
VPTNRILLISPVFNEGAHIGRVVRSVAEQRLPPARWIVTDDDSSDQTLAILRDWETRVPFMEVVENPGKASRERDGLATAREAVRFNAALELANVDDYDFIGKLDGDIELAPHHFERLLGHFADDPALGIAGCELVEPAAEGPMSVKIPSHHVHGAVKLYSIGCFKQIGGMVPVLGWDVVDETFARMRGFRTQTFQDVEANHLRPAGSAAGRVRGRVRAGEVAYIVQYEPWWVVPRAAKVALTRPWVISGAAFLYGYVRAAIERRERIGDEEYRRFVRREFIQRVRRTLRA